MHGGLVAFILILYHEIIIIHRPPYLGLLFYDHLALHSDKLLGKSWLLCRRLKVDSGLRDLSVWLIRLHFLNLLKELQDIINSQWELPKSFFRTWPCMNCATVNACSWRRLWTTHFLSSIVLQLRLLHLFSRILKLNYLYLVVIHSASRDKSHGKDQEYWHCSEWQFINTPHIPCWLIIGISSPWLSQSRLQVLAPTQQEFIFLLVLPVVSSLFNHPLVS